MRDAALDTRLAFAKTKEGQAKAAMSISKTARDYIRQTAMRVHRDPTAATLQDAKKMAAALLMLLDGRLPQ